MNKVKEKKLSAIKSEISEIKDFVTSNINRDDSEITSHDLGQNTADTITLTKIVETGIEELSETNSMKINNELNSLKLIMIKHEKLLQEILFKIK